MSSLGRILIVDDEVSMREFLEILMRKEGHDVVCADGGVQAFSRLSEGGQPYDVVITDLKMPQVDGLQVLERVKEVTPDTEVIVMTAYSSTETAINAMRMGAYDYISKPFKVDEITVIVQRCLEKRRLALENRRLKGELETRYSFSSIVGKSDEIRAVFEIIETVARNRTSVLVTGETGTGKELVAKAIHYNSPRKDKPFLVINCGAIPDQLMESELFGHTKGSFTGAHASKKGMFEVADGGTLFLDELGELSLSLQVKLLRVLQERRVKPVGGAQEIDVDVRIIAATNRDLEDDVAKGRFRQDLYYRLNVVEVPIPALRERRVDIPLIAQSFLERYSKEMGNHVNGISADALDALMAYSFPGNVRELENIIERALTFERGVEISLGSLPTAVTRDKEPAFVERSTDNIEFGEEGLMLEDFLAEIEKQYILSALKKTKGNRTDAARILGISFRSIRYKLAKYDITDEVIASL